MLQPAEKGIWIDLLCHMMQAEPYGHLAVNGKPMEDDDAARLCGTDKGTYKGCLKRLEDLGVSSRTEAGVLFSRRLVRDHEAYQQAAENGRKGGGNPSLRLPPEEKNAEAISQNPEATKGLEGGIKEPIKGNKKRKTGEGVEPDDVMKEIGSWYGRRPTTMWSREEEQTLRDLTANRPDGKPEDYATVRAWYSYRSWSESLFPKKRHDLITLLRNWRGEADKARSAIRHMREGQDPFFAKEVDL
jgi:hypothetical protein